MKNLINNQPKEIQVILSCICKKRQSDFLDERDLNKYSKSDLMTALFRHKKLIEILSDCICEINGWQLKTEYWLEDIEKLFDKKLF